MMGFEHVENDPFYALSQKLAGLQLNDTLLAQASAQNEALDSCNISLVPSGLPAFPTTDIPILPHLLPSTPLPPLSMSLYIAEAIQTNTLTLTFDESTANSENIHEFCSRWAPSGLDSTCEGIEWIAVNRGPWPVSPGSPNPYRGAPTPQAQILASAIPSPTLESLQNSFTHLVSTHRVDGTITLTVSALDTLALSHGITSGKWLIFVDGLEADVDRIWRNIVELVCLAPAMSERGVFAKIGKNRERSENDYIIYIYVPDFSDVSLVFEIRRALRELGVLLGRGEEAENLSSDPDSVRAPASTFKSARALTKKIGFKMDLYSVLGIYRRNPWGISVNRWFQ